MNATENTASKGPIKAVLFDLGDTLLNFGRIKPREIFAAGARLSYDYLKSLDQPVGGFKWYSLRSLVSLRLCRWLSALRGRDFDSLELLKKAGTKRGVRLTDKQWEHLTWLWYEPLTKIGQAEPGLKDTLAALKNSGLKLGILSNTFVHCSALEKHIEQLGILDFFDVRLYSYQFPFRKPDARIFKIAAERIGEAPQNILYVGDRIDKDIKPAIRAGMIAVLKDAHTNSGKKLPPGAARISRISDLPPLIKKINAISLPN
ncbi:MAG TPA: HAD family hydrolase [Sedimentisphaerales bacterium]|nr:HAD family hydrolase [Sedimentisphaerales bacterium]